VAKLDDNIPMNLFVEPWELIEPENPSLKKIAEFRPILASVDEKTFYANLNKIVDRVCEHFGIGSDNKKRRSKIKKRD